MCQPDLLRQAQGYVEQHVKKRRRADSPLFRVYDHALPDAHVLVNDVYATVLPRLVNLSIDTSLGGYLHAALRHHWLSLCTRQVNSRPYLATAHPSNDEDESLEPYVCHPAPYDLEADVVFRLALDAYEQKLDEQERAVFQMRMDGYKIAAIAEALGVSDKTIDRALSRIRVVMRPLKAS